MNRKFLITASIILLAFVAMITKNDAFQPETMAQKWYFIGVITLVIFSGAYLVAYGFKKDKD